jgi:hypothetical protein
MTIATGALALGFDPLQFRQKLLQALQQPLGAGGSVPFFQDFLLDFEIERQFIGKPID